MNKQGDKYGIGEMGRDFVGHGKNTGFSLEAMRSLMKNIKQGSNGVRSAFQDHSSGCRVNR